MELRDYLGALRKRWRIVAWSTLVCIAAAGALTILTERVYEARAQSYVALATTVASDTPGSIYQGSQFVVQQVKSYTQLVDSPAVLQPVIDELGLDTTVAALRDDVDASSPLDTVLIDVQVRDGDPAAAATIANAVAGSLGRVIQALETPEGGQPAVVVSTTEPAEPPAAPVTPRPKINLALGLVVGLGLGMGFAVLREQLDNTIRSADDLQQLTGSTALGVVGFDPRGSRDPLVALDQRSPRAEPYRTIRTNLQFVDVDEPPTRFVVTSSAVSEGKTTTACNLALTYALAGTRVCVVECDLRRPLVAERLGVSGDVGLTNVLIGQQQLDDVLVTSGHHESLSVLPAGTLPPDPGVLLGSRAMGALLDDLANRFDIVIIDAPPIGPVADAAVVSRLVDGVIVVARYGRTTRARLGSAVDVLTNAGARVLGTVITFVPQKWGDRAYVHYDRLNAPERAPAAESTAATRTSHDGQPTVPGDVAKRPGSRAKSRGVATRARRR